MQKEMDIDTAHHILNRFILLNTDMSAERVSQARIALAYLVEHARQHSALPTPTECLAPNSKDNTPPRASNVDFSESQT